MRHLREKILSQLGTHPALRGELIPHQAVLVKNGGSVFVSQPSMGCADLPFADCLAGFEQAYYMYYQEDPRRNLFPSVVNVDETTNELPVDSQWVTMSTDGPTGPTGCNCKN